MVNSCCVVGCSARQEKGSKWKFFALPKNEPARSQWLRAIKRKDFNPSKSTPRVCGRHFVTGQRSLDPNHPDYAPTLYMGYTTPDGCTDRPEKARVKLARAERQRMRDQDFLGSLPELDDSDCWEEYHTPFTEAETTMTLTELQQENNQLIADLELLRLENEDLKRSLAGKKFSAESIKDDNKRTRFYTGLPNYQTFLWLVSLVSLVLPSSRILSPADVLLLVLVKLRLNLRQEDLAFRFEVSQPLISKLLNASLPVLAKSMKFLVRWPSKQEILDNLPLPFKFSRKFKYTRVIIDCTEVFVERSSNLLLRALTWSNYKHHNTLKFLVGISPAGAISFISKAYGGRATDKVITLKSGLLDLLEYGDLVMADRGFVIADLLASIGVRLAIPAFTKGKTQLSSRDVEETRCLARIRIHVERAMGRLKEFAILQTIFPISLVHQVDNIFIVCSAIANLHPCLIK